MDEILHAGDAVLAEVLLDDGVVGEREALLVDAREATLVDELTDLSEPGSQENRTSDAYRQYTRIVPPFPSQCTARGGMHGAAHRLDVRRAVGHIRARKAKVVDRRRVHLHEHARVDLQQRIRISTLDSPYHFS